MTFEEGAHDQTWDGFNFANGTVNQTGCVMFGGYSGLAAAHHITLRNITVGSTITGAATTVSSPTTDHAVYFARP